MKHIQHVRGKWIARVTVPEELREIIGKRELIEELPSEKSGRDRRALAVLNGFFARLDEAREILLSRRPTLSSAAKELYRVELEADDMSRAARRSTADDFARTARSVYANKLRLLAAGHVGREEAEALIGYAADDLAQRGHATRTDNSTKPSKTKGATSMISADCALPRAAFASRKRWFTSSVIGQNPSGINGCPGGTSAVCPQKGASCA